mgnify:CR=1 FL=1
MALFGKREIVFEVQGDKDRWQAAKAALTAAGIKIMEALTREGRSNQAALRTDLQNELRGSRTESNQTVQSSMEQLGKLRGCEVHSSVILSQVDERTFKRLGVNLTCEPRYAG